MTASAALNYFIAKGLWGIEKVSQKQCKDLQDLEDIEFFKDQESALGSTMTAKVLAYISIVLSVLSLIANVAETGRTIGFYLTHNDTLIKREWAFTVLFLTNTVNLIGFILFNVLGRRNADYLAVITKKTLRIKEFEVEGLEKSLNGSTAEIERLKKRLADILPAAPALVTEVSEGTATSGTPMSTSAAGTGLPIPAVAATISANPLLGDAASPSSPATPGAE